MKTPRLSQDNRVTLRALEVLNLIDDEMERHGGADPEDIDIVLRFFRDVAHRCLDNTERSLLTHFIDLESGIGHQGRVGSTLERHRRAHTLLAEMENCFREGRQEEFVSASRRYTLVMGDLIFHETEFLPALLAPHIQDRGFQQMMEEFARVETGLAAAARQASRTMHRLESKYVSPHCI